MIRGFSGGLIGLLTALLVPTAAFAGHNLADYPLRVHIFQQNSHSHYFHQVLETVDGEGKADLYENGEARGFEYSYRCGERLRISAEYETYPARWKKQGQKLEILMPHLGKPGTMDSCELMVDMKEFAFYVRNGRLVTEPVEDYKAWMVKHEYDPEHGKNQPAALAAQPASATNTSQ